MGPQKINFTPISAYGPCEYRTARIGLDKFEWEALEAIKKESCFRELKLSDFVSFIVSEFLKREGNES